MAKLVKHSLAKLNRLDRQISVYLSALAEGRSQAVKLRSYW